MRQAALSVIALLCFLGGGPIDAGAAAQEGSDGTSSSASNQEGAGEEASATSDNKKAKHGGKARPIPPRKTGRQSQPNSIRVETDKTTFTFGGAVWVNFAAQDWRSPDKNRKRGMNFDNLWLIHQPSGQFLLI